MNRKPRKFTSGFTLIELLVVITIIGVLSAVFMVNFKEGPKRARDSQRVQDIMTFINAVKQYKVAHGEYPGGGDDGGVQLSPNCASDIKSDLVSTGFMSRMVEDPKDAACEDDSDDAYFYGWDASHCCEGEYCVSINRLETEWAVELLKERFDKLHYVTGGGDANIGTGDDFNFCFKMR